MQRSNRPASSRQIEMQERELEVPVADPFVENALHQLHGWLPLIAVHCQKRIAADVIHHRNVLPHGLCLVSHQANVSGEKISSRYGINRLLLRGRSNLVPRIKRWALIPQHSTKCRIRERPSYRLLRGED